MQESNKDHFQGSTDVSLHLAIIYCALAIQRFEFSSPLFELRFGQFTSPLHFGNLLQISSHKVTYNKLAMWQNIYQSKSCATTLPIQSCRQ